MTREKLMCKTLHNLAKLPNQKLQEVSDYIETLLKSIDQKFLTDGIQQLVSESKSFEFLAEEEDLYSEQEVIEKYLD